MNAYDELRSLGVSVETADAIAPIIDALPPKKRKAFFLWVEGYTQKSAAKTAGVGYRTMKRIINSIRVSLFSSGRSS